MKIFSIQKCSRGTCHGIAVKDWAILLLKGADSTQLGWLSPSQGVTVFGWGAGLRARIRVCGCDVFPLKAVPSGWKVTGTVLTLQQGKPVAFPELEPAGART